MRAYGLIDGVARAGHQIHLFCFAEAPPTESPLHERCERIVPSSAPHRRLADRLRDIVFSPHADMARRFWSDDALAQLRELIAAENYDLIHAESIEMAAYFLYLKDDFPQMPFIYGSLNAEADLQRSIFKAEVQNPRRWIGALYSWIQWRRLSRLEAHICDLSATVLAVSEADQHLLERLSQTPVAVVKNGITVDDYTHITNQNILGDGAIVFTGSMAYRPNVDAAVWFADAILPKIQHPQRHFYIVGHRPHARVLALQENPHITVTGRVESIEDYWTGARAYVVPLRMGSGTRFKILEAMAAGCPVVSTTIGAMGLGAKNGVHLLLADDANAFAEAVQSLLEDSALRSTLAEAGYQFVRQYFDWSVIVPDLLGVYEDVRS